MLKNIQNMACISLIPCRSAMGLQGYKVYVAF
nr:MAG TPA: RRM in Demeter [Caudoviricetes sp.]